MVIMMKEEKEKFVRNQFVLEGNVSSFGKPYSSGNDKQRMRFTLAQTRNDNTQFVPIILPTKLVETYGKSIQKGDWLTVKGSINSYSKRIEKNGEEHNEQRVDIIALEVENKKTKQIYKSDGSIVAKEEKEMER